uniref:Protein Asterix n=1 Tax=Cannabis sativa TaxID=3483 RepID=A0A803P9L3_CANSA
MSSHGNASVVNDPRQPSAARPFMPQAVAPQDLPVDYSGFIAVIFGVFGVMFRYKLCSWLAIIFCAQSLANMKNFETDLKQVSMAFISRGFGSLPRGNLGGSDADAVNQNIIEETNRILAEIRSDGDPNDRKELADSEINLMLHILLAPRSKIGPKMDSNALFTDMVFEIPVSKYDMVFDV